MQHCFCQRKENLSKLRNFPSVVQSHLEDKASLSENTTINRNLSIVMLGRSVSLSLLYIQNGVRQKSPSRTLFTAPNKSTDRIQNYLSSRTRTIVSMMSTGEKHLTLMEVEELCRNALSMSGLNPVATEAITEVVTSAERDGCHSHGLFRLPGYCQVLLNGRVDGSKQPEVHDAAPGVVRVDAGGAFSPPAILAGRDLAVRKARENGIACLSIHNSMHFAALWWEVEALANQGIVSLAFVNSRSFVAQQPFGKRKLYGTNPMAFGFPRAPVTTADEEGKRGPLVWDQASAAMARGEIQLCQRDGHTLPEGVAIDKDGLPTTNPEAALVGFALIFDIIIESWNHS